jgi:hypothetical protein
MPSFPSKPVVFALLCGIFGLGCGAGSKQGTTPAQLSPDDSRLFEQGVDFIAKLDGLEGRWREDWDRDLQQRVGAADLVALVTVNTLRTDTDPEQRVTHHVVARVDRVVSGEAPGEEIELSVKEGAAGFATVDQALTHLAEQQFVAYVKWLRGEGGRSVPYFHLSPASEQVLAETEGYVARLKTGGQPTERVTVHNN